MENRKRIINFRSFLFLVVCIIISIFIARLYFSNAFWSILLFAFFVLLLICIFTRRISQRLADEKTVSLIVAAILCICVYCIFIGQQMNWLPSEFYRGKSYEVTGTVDSNTLSTDGRIIIISDVYLSGNAVDGKLRIYITETDGKMTFAREGDIVGFSAKIFDTAYNSSNYRKNQRLYASVNEQDLSLSFGRPSFIQSVRAKIRKALSDNLEKKYADLAYGIITGDKNNLSYETTDYYSASGLAHILAVSGLHIGFCTMLLMWLLKNLRANKFVIFAVLFIALMFYAYVADFSPSVLRAIIMSTTGSFTLLIAKRRDALNSLCCAACIILAVKPMYLFEIGFIMSVCAVLGIILFARPIRKTLDKMKLPRFLTSGISASISTQIGIMPSMLYFFKSIAVYSIFANILLMFVIMVTFVVIVSGVMIAVFIPAMGFIIEVGGKGLFIIDEVAQITAALPFARRIVFSSAPIFIACVIYFLASRFVRKGKHAEIVAALMMSACCVIAALCNFSYKTENAMVPVTTAYYDVTTVVSVDGKVYVIGDFNSAIAIRNTLLAARFKRVDAVFVNQMDERTAAELVIFSGFYKGLVVYFPLTEKISGINSLMDRYDVHGFAADVELENKIFSVYDDGYNFLCYSLENNITALFFGMSSEVEKIPQSVLFNADIIRSYIYVQDSLANRTYLVNSSDSPDEYYNEVVPMYESEYVIYYYKSGEKKRIN